jgi:hypothetical protein
MKQEQTHDFSLALWCIFHDINRNTLFIIDSRIKIIPSPIYSILFNQIILL